MRYEFPYGLTLLLAAILLVAVYCSGCFGVSERGKSVRIQIPALLDVEVEYVEESDPVEAAGNWKELFVPSTIKEIFDEEKEVEE